MKKSEYFRSCLLFSSLAPKLPAPLLSFMEVPHRHLVFSLPKAFRKGFLYNRELLQKLPGIVWRAYLSELQEVTGKENGRAGTESIRMPQLGSAKSRKLKPGKRTEMKRNRKIPVETPSGSS